MTPAKHKIFSPARIGAIASNTLLELVRLKVFYFLLIFALILIGSSVFIVRFTFEEQFQMLKAFALGAISIFTWLLATLPTAMLLPKDVEDRTLYTILAKPVPRFEYLIGKLLGVLVLLLITTAVMSVMFIGALYFREQQAIAETMKTTPPEQIAETVRALKANALSVSLVPAVVMIYLKAAIFASLTLFISTYASSWIFTIMISVSIYVIGHLQSTAREYWMAGENAGPLTKIFLAIISLIFPDLQLFNLVDDIIAGNAIHAEMFWRTAGLGGLYCGVYLLVAYFVFAGKEL